MKLRLPNKLVAALMAAMSATVFTTLTTGSSAYAEGTIASSAEANLGNIMFSGDSITHGVSSPSYRYFLFKILTDNGIGNNAVGPLKGNWSGDEYTGTQYGGETFTNVHAAEYGSRSYEIANTTLRSNPDSYGFKWTPGNVGAAYVNTYINNWLGLDTLKKDGATPYTGDTYNVDTFMMLIGTNDMLTDIGSSFKTAEKLNNALGAMLGASYTDNGDGTHSFSFSTAEQEATSEASLVKIWRSVKQANADANMVFMGVPAVGVAHGSANKAVLDTVNLYNEALKTWCEDHGVTYVQSDTGLRDVTSAAGVGVRSMYRPDQCHLSYQGDLIFGGNVAKAMGYAGRTVGLSRSDAATESAQWTAAAQESYTLSSGSQTIASDIFSVTNGYTVDFNGLFGDGESNGWAAQGNALTLTIGDGSRTGTLNLSEGFVMWNGSTILYSKDNHVASDNLRVAYVNGGINGLADGVTAGYYVWLGDVLIGEGLSATTGSGLLNGITLSANGGTGTVNNLTWANTAYAPTTTLYSNASAGFRLTQISPRESYDSDAQHLKSVSFTGIDAVSGGQYATSINTATGNIAVVRTGDREGSQAWVGAVGAAHTGNVDINFKNFNTSSAVILAVVSNSVEDGNVSVVLDGGTNIDVSGSFSNSGTHSFHGAYRAGVGGNLQLEVNDATLKGGILMGHADGNGTITGDTKLIINKDATIGGPIFGGSSSAGTISGNTDITITGGTVNGSIYGGNRANGTVVSRIGGNTNITITGGRITGNVVGGNENGSAGTIGGSTNVTVVGTTATIGGTITADNVTLRGIADTGYDDGIDKYSRAITATEKLTLDAYTAGHVNAPITTKAVLATGNTNTTISNLTLTACDITAETGSQLTLEGTLTLGNTATYSGDIRVADGIIFSMSNETAASLASAGYSSGVSGYRTLGTASLLTSSDASRLKTVGGAELTKVNVNTYTGTGALEGATFSYNAETGTLSATSDRVLGSTYYVNDDVTYDRSSDVYNATAFVIGDGGNLTLARDLKDGVTITGAAGSTTSTITVDNGVTLAKSAVSGTIASYVVNGTLDLGNAGTTTQDLRNVLTGNGTVKVAYATQSHNGAQLWLGNNFTGIADISGSLQFYGSQEVSQNATFYLHDGEAWYSNSAAIANALIFGGTYTLRPGSDTTLSGVLSSVLGDSTQNLILGCEADKNKTVTFSDAGNANINKVTLAYDNLVLKGVQGEGTNRTLYTGNVVVEAGRTLSLNQGDNTNTTDVNAAAKYHGSVLLNGANESTATLLFEAGSTFIEDGIVIQDNGSAKLISNIDKHQYIQSLSGKNVTLTLHRNDNSSRGWGGYFHLMGLGELSGTLQMSSATTQDYDTGLILHNCGDALANTVVRFLDSSNKKTELAFVNANNNFYNEWGKLNVSASDLTDGAVAGLEGTKGRVQAKTLTINLSGDHAYSGVLNVAGLVLTGTGTQHFDTKNVSFGGSRLVNSAGTGEEAGGSAFTKMFTGQGLTIADGAKLVLDGNVMFTEQNRTGGTYTSAVREMEITGNLKMNVWSAHVWDLRDHKLTVGSGTDGGYLWLTNQQNMVGYGANLKIGGELILGHQENQNNGRYKSYLELNNGTFSAGAVTLSGGGNRVILNNSDVTFSRTTENASTNLLVDGHTNGRNTERSDYGNDDTVITLSGNTLNSGANGWNLTAIDGVTLTVDGATKLDIADGKNITIGGATVSGSLTHKTGSAGTLELAGDTINGVTLADGKFGLSGASTINGTLHVNNGTLTIAEGATATIITGTDLTRYELKGTGTGGTGEIAYSNGASGYLLGDSATYYLVKQNGTSSVSGDFTSVTGTNVTYNNDYTFTITGRDTSTYYVNENLAYNADNMGEATYLNIAKGVTLTAPTTAPTSAKTLIGTGSYVLQTNSQTLGDNMSLGADWRGCVVVSGNITNFNLSNLGTAQSSIEIKGLHGWFNSHAVSANVIIGEGGLDFNNGNDGTTLTFNGNLSGTGDIIRSTTAQANVGVAFKGDVSEYTGNILHNRATNTTFTVTFADKANVINANLKTAQYAYGTLSINFNAADTVVNGEVDNTDGFRDANGNYNHKVNVTATQDVTFNNTVKVNSLSAAGHNIVLGSHTMEDGTVTHGDLTVTVPDVQNQTQMRSLTMLEGTHASFNGKLMASSVTLNGTGTTLALGNIDHTITDLVINDGALVTAGGHLDQWGFNHGVTHINGGGKLELTRNDTMGWGSNGAQKIILEGTEGKKATLQLDGNNVLYHGIEMKGNAQIIGNGDNGLLETAQDAGTYSTISVSGTNNTFAAQLGQRRNADTLHLDVAKDGELLVTGKTRGHTGDDSDASALYKEGEGTVIFNNDADIFYGYTNSAGTTVLQSAATIQSNPLKVTGGLFEVNAAGKAVALNSDVTVTGGAFTLTNGNITLNNANTFTATNSVVTINGGTFTTGTNGITIGNGGVLNLAATSGTNAGSTSFLRGSVTVQNGGQLVLTGHDATGYNGGDSALQKITVQEGGQLLLGFDNSNETYVGTLILDGTLDMQQGHSGSRVDLFSKNGHNAKIQVSDNAHGVVAAGVTLKLREDNAEFAVGSGGTLTVNGGFIKGENGNNKFRKTGAGEMIINTSLDNGNGVNGISLEAGTLTLNGESNKMGALTISGGAALKTFGGEINGLTMSGGSITNSGSLSIGGTAVLTNMTAMGDAVSGFSDGDNGFTTATNNYQLVTNTGIGTVASTVTSWTINGTTASSATLASDGVLSATVKATDGIYHVNQTMAYDGTTATDDMRNATLFSVEPSIELQIDGGLLGGRNVTLADGATLKALDGSYDFTNNQIGTLTLTGETGNINTGLHNIALRGASGSTLTLNGHKLNVTGGNRLGLINTTVDAGTISVTNDGGVIAGVQVGYGSSANSVVAAEATTFEFAGGQLVMGGGSTATFKGLTMATDSTIGVIIGDNGATGGNIKLALGGGTYTYRGSIANNINLTTTGAGTQNFVLSTTANLGKVKTEAGNMNFSGLIASVATGIELGAQTNVTFEAGARLAEGSRISVGSGATLTLKQSENTDLRDVTLGGGTLNLFSGNSRARTFTASSLAVTGANTLAAADGGYHGQVDINNLSSTESGAELTLVQNAVVDRASVFNINSGGEGAFNGTIHLKQAVTSTTNNRHVAMNLKDADVLSNTVISMESVANSKSNVALGIAAESVTVKGITTADTNGEKVIFSGAAELGAQSYNGDGTERTLVINTAGSEYTADATVKSNLNITKAGAGTQAFTGDMSAFNGNITVEAGTLDLDTATVMQAKRVQVKADSLLELKKGASVSVKDLVLGNGAAVITKNEAAAALLSADAPTPYSDDDVAAHITVTGTQQDRARLEASGTTTVSTDLTVGSNTQMVYSSSVPQGVEGGINLNGHSLTLSATGGDIFITGDMMTALSNTEHLTLFSNVGGLTLNGVNFAEAMTQVSENLYITAASTYFGTGTDTPLALGKQYTVAYNTDTKELYLAPEPATTALSLLALTALAARRKRK